MKSSTSADTVILTDQQGREELRVIFDNVDTAILPSYYLCKERNCGERQDKFRSNKSKFKNSVSSKHVDSGHLFTNKIMECFAYPAANTTRETYVTILILGMQLHR